MTYKPGTIKEMIATSTCHGISNVFKSKRTLVKVIWLFSFFLCSGYCVYLVYGMFSDYLDFKVNIQIETKTDVNSKFPAITFCNMNPVDFSNNSGLEKLISTLNSRLSENLLNLTNFTAVTIEEYKKLNFANYNKVVLNFFLGFNLKYDYGPTLDKMLLSCRYDRQPCSPDDFQRWISQDFGSCFTFNGGKNSLNKTTQIRKFGKPGRGNGLQVELFIGKIEQVPDWISSQGITLVVHNPNLKPNFKQDIVFLPAGIESNLILSRTIREKLPSPYTDCYSEPMQKNQEDGASSTKISSEYYQQKSCLLECAGRKMLMEMTHKCGIRNISIIGYLNCVADDSGTSKYYVKCGAECPEECRLTSFTVNQYQLLYPTPRYFNEFIKKQNLSNNVSFSSMSYEESRNDFLSFNVYFDSYDYTIISEDPQMTFDEMLANLGGQMGLFLGISFLSFIEIIEIFIEFIYKLTSNRSRIGNTRKISEKN